MPWRWGYLDGIVGGSAVISGSMVISRLARALACVGVTHGSGVRWLGREPLSISAVHILFSGPFGRNLVFSLVCSYTRTRTLVFSPPRKSIRFEGRERQLCNIGDSRGAENRVSYELRVRVRVTRKEYGLGLVSGPFVSSYSVLGISSVFSRIASPHSSLPGSLAPKPETLAPPAPLPHFRINAKEQKTSFFFFPFLIVRFSEIILGGSRRGDSAL